eukprot:2425571-Pleurochrysis_carterae.AAC.1
MRSAIDRYSVRGSHAGRACGGDGDGCACRQAFSERLRPLGPGDRAVHPRRHRRCSPARTQARRPPLTHARRRISMREPVVERCGSKQNCAA